MRLQRDGTFSIATSENFFGIYSVEGVLRHGKRAMPAPICTNIHRKNEVTNNRQLLLADGFSFYAVAEISTTSYVLMTSKLCSYGVKSVFSRGRNCGLVRLKQGSKHCNAIEKDRLLRRE